MASTPQHHMEASGSNAGSGKRSVCAPVIALLTGLLCAALSTASSSITTELAGSPLLALALPFNAIVLIFGYTRYRNLKLEVEHRRNAEEISLTIAKTDPLTGCLNRLALDGALQTMIASARMTGHEVVAIVIDLDHFKRSNDIHGHLIGDAVLLEASSRIRSTLPDGAIMARLGGDEFACAAIFDPDHTSAVERLVSRINQLVARPINVDHLSIEVTASVGLAATTGSNVGKGESLTGKLASTLLHHADLAMYQAKKSGRNGYCWFDAGLEQELRYRNELERGIREGIPGGQFVPFYEKQIDLDTGELTGFEMLARWEHPTRGLLSPDVFISVAEEIGVISDLSESLIRQALQDARDWDPKLTLSVNISPVQLRDPWFAQRLLKLLHEANFPPHRLDIEITENCLHENLGVVQTLVTSLRNQGIRISLDDFGTGYSSFAQLRTLPFDRIKIDRYFVSSLDCNKDSATIIEAISSLGKGLGLPITAEGIENSAVLDELRKYGSFKGQGYLYGQPTDARTVHSMLEQQNMLRTSATDKAACSLPEQAAAA